MIGIAEPRQALDPRLGDDEEIERIREGRAVDSAQLIIGIGLGGARDRATQSIRLPGLHRRVTGGGVGGRIPGILNVRRVPVELDKFVGPLCFGQHRVARIYELLSRSSGARSPLESAPRACTPVSNRRCPVAADALENQRNRRLSNFLIKSFVARRRARNQETGKLIFQAIREARDTKEARGE